MPPRPRNSCTGLSIRLVQYRSSSRISHRCPAASDQRSPPRSRRPPNLDRSLMAPPDRYITAPTATASAIGVRTDRSWLYRAVVAPELADGWPPPRAKRGMLKPAAGRGSGVPSHVIVCSTLIAAPPTRSVTSGPFGTIKEDLRARPHRRRCSSRGSAPPRSFPGRKAEVRLATKSRGGLHRRPAKNVRGNRRTV